MALTTGLPKEKIVIEPSFIGGEFGAKALTIEEFPLYYLAHATGRPVKHVRTHADDVRSTHVRHAAKIRRSDRRDEATARSTRSISASSSTAARTPRQSPCRG